MVPASSRPQITDYLLFLLLFLSSFTQPSPARHAHHRTGAAAPSLPLNIQEGPVTFPCIIKESDYEFPSRGNPVWRSNAYYDQKKKHLNISFAAKLSAHLSPAFEKGVHQTQVQFLRNAQKWSLQEFWNNTASLLQITSYENEPLITFAFLISTSLCKVKNILPILHKPS